MRAPTCEFRGRLLMAFSYSALKLLMDWLHLGGKSGWHLACILRGSSQESILSIQRLILSLVALMRIQGMRN